MKIKIYNITGVSKEDIIEAFDGDKKIRKIVSKMTDEDMQHLASKMADDYLNQLYWSSLEIIFRDIWLKED